MSDKLRIVFATDPSPIRSGPSHYRFPFELFGSIADAIENSKTAIVYILATDALISTCTFKCQKIFGSQLGFDQTWPTEWKNTWPNLINAVDPVSFEQCRIFFKQNHINVLFICDKHDTIREAAIAENVKVIHLAQGPLRSPKTRLWLVDPKGIGPDSLCSESFFRNTYADDYAIAEIGKIADAVVDFHHTKRKRLSIMIALQPHDDIPSIIWNDIGPTTVFIQELFDCAAQHKDIIFCLRKHPNDPFNFANIMQVLPNNVMYDDGSKEFWSSISDFDALINLSSAAGCEATLLGIPVLTLGKGMFSVGIQRNQYTKCIDKFVDDISTGKFTVDSGFHVKFSKIMMKFLVDEAYIRLPSFYISLSYALLKSHLSANNWFDEYCGLQHIKNQLQSFVVMQEIYNIKAENYKRIQDLGYIHNLMEKMRDDIHTLKQENHKRIIENDFLSRYLSDI